MVNRDIAVTLTRRVLNDSIWRSTIIEGLGVTFPATDAILNNAPSSAKPSDIQFIINMKHAWLFLLDTLDLPMDLSLLREFNKLCGQSLIYESGDLRKRDVIISGCSYVPAIPQYADVVDDISKLNEIKNPLQRALAYFCYVARTQLFIDGNKRVAQLAMNKILVENGIGVFHLQVDDLEKFAATLVNYYETADPTRMFQLLKRSIYYF